MRAPQSSLICTCPVMEGNLSRTNFLTMILCNYKVGLILAFGEPVPWQAADFKRGRESLEDEARLGRAKTAERWCQIDPWWASKRPKDCFHLAYEHSGVNERSARWVPHNLSEEQKQQRVECCCCMLDRSMEEAPGVFMLSSLVMNHGFISMILCYMTVVMH